ncbi:hypothetical protein DPMN_076527 [Dreissena polymorpha]|uniref:Uncharacterized protein n=1 Tax=Dreissena polymorpha TaxID=45954 RepID=A0A9D4BNF5_DREPO|nr:hypothetical protein DPMN_076527 [Dreissena polymorpha]
MGITPQTLSSALARVFLNIAGYVKHHPKDSMKVGMCSESGFGKMGLNTYV